MNAAKKERDIIKNIKVLADVKQHLGITQDVFQRVFNKSFTELKKEWGFQAKGNNIYTREIILEILEKKLKEKGSYLTLREMMLDEELPALTTIYRIFNTHSIKKIYLLIKK